MFRWYAYFHGNGTSFLIYSSIKVTNAFVYGVPCVINKILLLEWYCTVGGFAPRTPTLFFRDACGGRSGSRRSIGVRPPTLTLLTFAPWHLPIFPFENLPNELTPTISILVNIHPRDSLHVDKLSLPLGQKTDMLKKSGLGPTSSLALGDVNQVQAMLELAYNKCHCQHSSTFFEVWIFWNNTYTGAINSLILWYCTYICFILIW